MIKAALVLEGGSFRSLYTSGVLDVFIENGIEFSCVIGVSAGTLVAVNYISKDIGRSAKINILHSNDKKYFGLRQFLFKRSAFNFDYLFRNQMRKKYPFDENSVANSKQRFLIGATNVKTGKTDYFEKKDFDGILNALQASCSIPVMCPMIKVDGAKYLDGAVDDVVGIHKAFSEGYAKVVTILTRDIDYSSKKMSCFGKLFFRLVYKRRYPNLYKTMVTRPERCNILLEEINALEKEKKLFVLRPEKQVKIKKLERDARKLIELYLQGREDARKMLPDMLKYLNS
ncbi:MAG: patatin family protein [Firmicutes bacterium]|nr:patatin family protein [Bacillota bacterium]